MSEFEILKARSKEVVEFVVVKKGQIRTMNKLFERCLDKNDIGTVLVRKARNFGKPLHIGFEWFDAQPIAEEYEQVTPPTTPSLPLPAGSKLEINGVLFTRSTPIPQRPGSNCFWWSESDQSLDITDETAIKLGNITLPGEGN